MVAVDPDVTKLVRDDGVELVVSESPDEGGLELQVIRTAAIRVRRHGREQRVVWHELGGDFCGYAEPGLQSFERPLRAVHLRVLGRLICTWCRRGRRSQQSNGDERDTACADDAREAV